MAKGYDQCWGSLCNEASNVRCGWWTPSNGGEPFHACKFLSPEAYAAGEQAAVGVPGFVIVIAAVLVAVIIFAAAHESSSAADIVSSEVSNALQQGRAVDTKSVVDALKIAPGNVEQAKSEIKKTLALTDHLNAQGRLASALSAAEKARAELRFLKDKNK